MDEPGPEAESQARRAAKIAWAKMIRKVYDPLTCPECGAQMRVISLIEDPAVIERILSWLGALGPAAGLRTLTAWRAREPAARLPSRPRHRLRLAQAALAVLALSEFAKGPQYLP